MNDYPLQKLKTIKTTFDLKSSPVHARLNSYPSFVYHKKITYALVWIVPDNEPELHIPHHPHAEGPRTQKIDMTPTQKRGIRSSTSSRRPNCAGTRTLESKKVKSKIGQCKENHNKMCTYDMLTTQKKKLPLIKPQNKKKKESQATK